MNLVLTHVTAIASGIFGTISDEHGNHIMFTGTHAYPDSSGKFIPKLPPGKYKCVKGEHILEHYNGGKPFITYEITEVPGHSKMLFHPGNWPQKESDGCQLTGNQIGNALDGGKMLMSSDKAFGEFLDIQNEVDSFELTVENVCD